MEDYIVLKNALTASDIEHLKTIKEVLRDDPESHKPRAVNGKRHNNVYNITNKTKYHEDLIFEWLDRFMPWDKNVYEYWGVNFYDLQQPYALHSDGNDTRRAFYQGIIPLSIEPSDKDAYTIVFDQTADTNVEWIAPVYNKPADYQPFYNKGIRDPNYFGGWSDEYKISDDVGRKHWGSKWDTTFREAYKGFSIKYEYKWEVGDIFFFDSKFTHCATELEEKGISQKTGLLFCLNRK